MWLQPRLNGSHRSDQASSEINQPQKIPLRPNFEAINFIADCKKHEDQVENWSRQAYRPQPVLSKLARRSFSIMQLVSESRQRSLCKNQSTRLSAAKPNSGQTAGSIQNLCVGPLKGPTVESKCKPVFTPKSSSELKSTNSFLKEFEHSDLTKTLQTTVKPLIAT